MSETTKCPICQEEIEKDKGLFCDHIGDNHPELDRYAKTHIHKETRAELFSCAKRVCRGQVVYINPWELLDHIYYKHLHPELGKDFDDTPSEIKAIPAEERAHVPDVILLAQMLTPSEDNQEDNNGQK